MSGESADVPHESRRRRRILAASALVDSAGDGLYLAGSALFFTRGMGIPVTTVGLGLTIAGVIGLAIGVELGRAADRFGPRDVFIVLMLGQTVAVASYVFVSGLLTLVVAATAASLCRQGALAARGALIGQVGGPQAPTLRGYLHAVVNVGIAAGAALAGLAVARDTHSAYVGLMLADAATFTLAAVAVVRLPPGRAGGRSEATPKGRALRDRRFVTLTALSSVICLQFVVTGYLLPLWVVFHTDAPRWFASPLLLLNTAVIVALQVRTSRRFPDARRAASAYRLAGFTLAGGFALFSLAHFGQDAALAGAVLVAAMLVVSLGELFTAAGAFGLSFGLAPEHAVGEYQGVWNLGFGTTMAVGPGVLTFVCLKSGPLGWLGLGLACAVTGVAMHAVATRALAARAEDLAAAAESLQPRPTNSALTG